MKKTLPIFLLAAAPGVAVGQSKPEVLSYNKISDSTSLPQLNTGDKFGSGVAPLGDLSGFGVAGGTEIVVGAREDGGLDQGAVWILGLDSAGSVAASRRIASGASGFPSGQLVQNDRFGASVTSLGDLNGDGVPEIAVGATGDDTAASGAGAVWILFLNADGTVGAQRKITEGVNGFSGDLDAGDNFGASVAGLGDIDGDGIGDLAVGALGDDADDNLVAFQHGAAWILLLNADGTVKSQVRLGAETGGVLEGQVLPGDQFGTAVGALGDVDGNNVPDLAVGAPFDDGGGNNRGAFYVLFMEADASVSSITKVGHGLAGFSPDLEDQGQFGFAITPVDLIDGFSPTVLAVGARGVKVNQGIVWIFGIDASGEVSTGGTITVPVRVGEGEGGFSAILDAGDFFGTGICALPDLDDNGVSEIVVVAPGDADGGDDTGAAWVLLMDGLGVPVMTPYSCGMSPPNSLVVLEGQGNAGTDLVVGVDNPFGTQSVGSIPFLIISLKPDAVYAATTADDAIDPTCSGSPLPGFHMAQPGATAELLVGVTGGVFYFFLSGEPWQGTGTPAPVTWSIPNLPIIMGQNFYIQGAMFDFDWFPNGVEIGMASATRLRIGPPVPAAE